MLANGATLGFKPKGGGAGSFTDLPGLKEIPEMGVDKEKVENTPIVAKNKRYEYGIGDLPDMVYKFIFDNTKADSPYRIMRAKADSNEVLTFQEKLSDGSITTFDAQVSVKRTGGGVNGVLDFDLTMSVQSDLTFTDPA